MMFRALDLSGVHREHDVPCLAGERVIEDGRGSCGEAENLVAADRGVDVALKISCHCPAAR